MQPMHRLLRTDKNIGAIAAMLLILPPIGPVWAQSRSPDIHYVPTPRPVVDTMLKLAKVGPEDVVYDLGSGDGRIVIAAAREFGATGVGVEIDGALVRQARANARKAGVADKVTFTQDDL